VFSHLAKATEVFSRWGRCHHDAIESPGRHFGMIGRTALRPVIGESRHGQHTAQGNDACQGRHASSLEPDASSRTASPPQGQDRDRHGPADISAETGNAPGQRPHRRTAAGADQCSSSSTVQGLFWSRNAHEPLFLVVLDTFLVMSSSDCSIDRKGKWMASACHCHTCRRVRKIDGFGCARWQYR